MTTDEVYIRPANLWDGDAIYGMICRLENRMMDRIGFDLIFTRNLQNDLIGYFVAMLGDRPVGMGSCHVQTLLHHAAFVGEIQEMYVDEDFRSQNIGSKLMDYLVAFAKDKGAIQLEVTSRDYRENAHRFYQKEDFEKSHVKLVRYF
jgi:PhnO protein